jgi:hypothetical protein
MYAAVFLGFKVAQLNVNLDLMKTMFPVLKEKDKKTNIDNLYYLFEYEFYLINVLNYEFYIFCPYKAMVGFIYDMKCSQKIKNIPLFTDQLSAEDFEKKCESFIDQTFLTDLMFVLSYSIIAISCIFLTAEFYQMSFDWVKALLQLEGVIDYENFFMETYRLVKSKLEEIKVLNQEEYKEKKSKIYKFLFKNPQYVEKIEKEREYYFILIYFRGLKIRMAQFSDNFENFLINGPNTSGSDKMIIDDDQNFIHHKRERDNN